MEETSGKRLPDWHRYVRDGEAYLGTALQGAAKRPGVFTPEILLGLTAMAIEKLIMGLLMRHGQLAENHTMADLAAALEHLLGPLPALVGELLFLDSFQDLCPLTPFERREPSADDLARILATGCQVQALVTKTLAGCAGAAA
ncbi:MAG: hypothetical protein AB1634_16190 [Thermodesulfobacteriota bacterium]